MKRNVEYDDGDSSFSELSNVEGMYHVVTFERLESVQLPCPSESCQGSMIDTPQIEKQPNNVVHYHNNGLENKASDEPQQLDVVFCSNDSPVIKARHIPLAEVVGQSTSKQDTEVGQIGQDDKHKSQAVTVSHHGQRQWLFRLLAVVVFLFLGIMLMFILVNVFGSESQLSPPTLLSTPTDTNVTTTLPPSMSPRTATPASIPQQRDTMAPTNEPRAPPSPAPSQYCFETSLELQNAVDEYTGAHRKSTMALYGKIQHWCVGKITNFSGLFLDKADFNEPLSYWDMSNAITTDSMFENAAQFDQDLPWNTSSTINMDRMFKGATAFNGNIKWDTSRVQSMTGMFQKTKDFKGKDLAVWNVSSVTRMDFVFAGSRSFAGNISAWDVSSVTTMRGMFQGTSFAGDLSAWNTGLVVDMSYMFWLAMAFDGGDISTWNVSSARDLRMMFQNARAFSVNLCPWSLLLQESALVEDMLLGSGCPESSDPDLTRAKSQFFCQRCD